MSSGLKLIKGAARRKALVYGMRLFLPGEVAEIGDARVTRGDGSAARVRMHFIEGTREQIRRQLMHSIDAFFELLDQ